MIPTNYHHKWLFIFMVLGLVLLSSFSFGQKFGKVPKEHLTMTEFPESPESDAVYLFDVGEMEIRDDFKLQLDRHVRIKILTEKGKKFADVKLRYWHEDKIRNIKAHTILPNGKKIKLNKKEIFDEQIKNTKIKSFTIPGVEVGSVIEYKYSLESEYLTFLEPWYFQHDEYTLYSRVSVTVPPQFSYTIFYRNIEALEPQVEEILRPGKTLRKYTWEMANLPPVKDEPYMRAPQDYLMAMHFQLIHYKDAFNYFKFIREWPDLVEKHWDGLDDFVFDKSQKDLVAQLTADVVSPKEKAKILFDFVRDSIKTTSKGNRWVEKSPKEVMKLKQGTGTDKNMLLVNLLNLAGIKAYPMLISTRANGRVFENQPRLNQFNYLLAYASIGNKDYVFDTRNRYCPVFLLPTSDLVEKGLVINEEKGKFITIPIPKKINMQYCRTEATLNRDGSLNATSLFRFEAYEAMKMRSRIANTSPKEVFEEILEDRFGNFEIDSITIKDLENVEVPLSVEISYRVPDYAQVVGDMMYVAAPFMDYYEKNPFTSPQRYFPVEFATNYAATDKITINLPEGIQPVELPKPVAFRMKGLSCLNNWKQDNGSIRVERQYMRRKLIFFPSEYQRLRSLYDHIVNADQAQIVLSEAASQPTTSEQ